MNELTKGKVIGYLAAIFLAGAVAGAVGAYAVKTKRPRHPSFPRQEEMALHIREKLQARLNLTSEQIARVEPLIQETCAEVRDIGRSSMMQTTEAFSRLDQRIAEVLTEPQKAEFQKFNEERKESFRRKCRDWTNGPPPGFRPRH